MRKKRRIAILLGLAVRRLHEVMACPELLDPSSPPAAGLGRRDKRTTPGRPTPQTQRDGRASSTALLPS